MIDNNCYQWVIYNSPIEYPGEFVARRWVITPIPVLHATDEVIRSKDLNSIRKEMEKRYLYRLDRHPTDDPSIVEIWI